MVSSATSVPSLLSSAETRVRVTSLKIFEFAAVHGFTSVIWNESVYVAVLPLLSVAVPVIVTVSGERATSVPSVLTIVKSSLLVPSLRAQLTTLFVVAPVVSVTTTA